MRHYSVQPHYNGSRFFVYSHSLPIGLKSTFTNSALGSPEGKQLPSPGAFSSAYVSILANLGNSQIEWENTLLTRKKTFTCALSFIAWMFPGKQSRSVALLYILLIVDINIQPNLESLRGSILRWLISQGTSGRGPPRPNTYTLPRTLGQRLHAPRLAVTLRFRWTWLVWKFTGWV